MFPISSTTAPTDACAERLHILNKSSCRKRPTSAKACVKLVAFCADGKHFKHASCKRLSPRDATQADRRKDLDFERVVQLLVQALPLA